MSLLKLLKILFLPFSIDNTLLIFTNGILSNSLLSIISYKILLLLLFYTKQYQKPNNKKKDNVTLTLDRHEPIHQTNRIIDGYLDIPESNRPRPDQQVVLNPIVKDDQIVKTTKVEDDTNPPPPPPKDNGFLLVVIGDIAA